MKESLRIKQSYVDDINKNKTKINIRQICILTGINYSQFLAGYNGDFNRISVKSLKKFVEAMHDELQMQDKIKSFRIYKCYFDLQTCLDIEPLDYVVLSDHMIRMKYLLEFDAGELTKQEIEFLKKECRATEKFIKDSNKK